MVSNAVLFGRGTRVPAVKDRTASHHSREPLQICESLPPGAVQWGLPHQVAKANQQVTWLARFACSLVLAVACS